MSDVLQVFERHAAPFFEQGVTLSGFTAQLEALLPSPSGHAHFDLACCLARLGQRERALSLLARATAIYHQHHADTGAAWCLASIEQVQKLVYALSNQSESELLKDWRRQSCSALKLKDIG